MGSILTLQSPLIGDLHIYNLNIHFCPLLSPQALGHIYIKQPDKPVNIITPFLDKYDYSLIHSLCFTTFYLVQGFLLL